MNPTRGMNVRWLLMAAVLALAPVWAVAAPQRAVAVLYDDSGSMAPNDRAQTRWIGANFSLQVLSSLLGDDDELFVATMAVPTQVQQIEVPRGVDAWLSRLKAEAPPNKGTPYAGVSALLGSLEKSSAREKWLIVLTDGAFDDFTESVARAEIDRFVKPLGIRPMFILLESGGIYAAQQYWQREANASVLQVSKARDLPARMEEVAALLTGRDSAGLSTRSNGAELIVSSKFPLRSLVVLTQGNPGLAVMSGTAGSRALNLRGHDIRGVRSNPELPAGAHVAHLSSTGGIDSGDEVARLRFNQALGAARVKVYADVAARMEVSVLDASGRAITRDAQGRHPVCIGEAATLRTDLIGTDGKSLTLGRADLAQFNVGFDEGGRNALRSAAQAGQGGFGVAVKPSAEMRLNPYARYPGYFHFQSEPVVLLPVNCSRQVEVRLVTALDADGHWSARVDQLDQAPPLRFTTLVDGRPATEAELARWSWVNHAESTWRLERSGADLLLWPRSGCCVFTWSRPKAQQGTLELRPPDTGNPRDKLKMPAPVGYSFVLPSDAFARLWWLYGCPLAALLGSLALAAYLWRVVIVKERFGPRARLHIQRDRRQRQEPLCRPGGLLKRWLWPSRRETRVIEGLRFYAIGRRGASIGVDGSSLNERYEVDGWVYDEERASRKRPQPDARLRQHDNIVRRRTGVQAAEAIDLRLQYSPTTGPAQWPDQRS